jgi:CheY-like chemotaxis protein
MEQPKNIFKILLIEDDEITNFITTSKLKNLGFNNVKVVLNGKLALDYLSENCPNLIFLDINMPVMDGFEFLENKYKQNLCENIPIVILTSSSRPSDQELASKYDNIIDYLEKPLSFDKIQAILKKVI